MSVASESAPSPDRGTSLTLLQRLRDNEADVWGRFVHLYGPLVRHWCVCWGASESDADDICQEVFRAVSGGIERFRKDRPGDTFRGWLGTVTRNQLLMHVRRNKRQP